jgi:cell division protein FtsI/penicillin-binding protein 2
MRDTQVVLAANFLALLVASLIGGQSCAAQRAATWDSAVAQAARVAPDARVAVLDIGSGRLLASARLAEAARTLAEPGSTLKPLVLYRLIAAGRWDPNRRIACSRKLRIAGRTMNCSHPQADPMQAREALAWSCNTYFAAVAASLKPGDKSEDLRSLLAPTGLLGQTRLAPGEATALFRDPRTTEEAQLTLLGVAGIRVSPLELAEAYRWLGLKMAALPDDQAARVVGAGLADSASFGMAGNASLGGVEVAGKTGTASLAAGPQSPQSLQSHGWFVGLAPAPAPRVVVVVYLPAGHGADAARVAADLLANSPLRQARP